MASIRKPMTLEIFDLGAKRKTAQFIVDTVIQNHPDLVAYEITRAARAMNALASKNIGATWDPNTSTGTVVAGFRTVGGVRKVMP